MKIVTSFLFGLVCVCQCRYMYNSGENNILNEDLVIETSNGMIKGNIQESPLLNLTFYAFQSIPYAEPPIGDLRFKITQPVRNWTGILDATKAPKACLQPLLAADKMSEDCLFLNIFTPALNPSTLLPVIFWIHGGFFVIGDGRINDNDPELLINENVIMVSINYRLGIFGYLSTEDDMMPGNYAIKDQIMALRWINQNIAKFGGDPNKITLMGQSAGGANVGLLLQTSLTRGLFSACIMESGTSLNLWSRTKNATSVAKAVGDFFQIKYNTSQELLTEMQKLDATTLLVGSTSVVLFKTALSNPVNGLLFGPTIEPLLQGAVTKKSYESLENGEFNRVPVLTGFNAGEGNTFLPVFDYLRIYLKLYDMDPTKLAPIDLNAEDESLKNIGEMIKKFYFGSEDIEASKILFAKFLTDQEFMRPANEFVRLLSKYTQTYFYRFSYEGNLPAGNGKREAPGPTHSEELEYIFYSPDQNPATPDDLVTRKRLVKLWTNFAKFHNPTPVRDPLFQNITWKAVEPSSINYLEINKDLKMMSNPDKRNIDFWKSIYGNYGNPPFDTY